MKVSCKVANLARALNVVSRSIGNAATLPVLANVLIATDKNRLKLSGTNLEMGANYWIGAQVKTGGAITVPARLLTDFVSNLNADTLELETDKNNLKVITAHHQTTLNGIDVEEFPSIPQVGKATTISLPAADFKDAITQVAGAASHDDARPVLNGVYIYNEGKTLYLVSTDSYRLAEKSVELPAAPKSKVSVIVPARSAQEVLRALSEDIENVTMAIDEGQVMFKFGDGEIISRQIEGQFPNYRELIPKEAATTVTVATEELANLAKISALFAQTSAGGVSIDVDAKAKVMKLSSVASQVGENVSEVEGAQIKGQDAQVTLNSRYISEALSVVNSDKIEFSITGKINPCIIRPVGAKDYLHIIMPLRS